MFHITLVKAKILSVSGSILETFNLVAAVYSRIPPDKKRVFSVTDDLGFFTASPIISYI